MALPINIEELVHGHTIEWERLEFKLRLTEGRGTGFPTIYGAMESNGSPEPVFTADDDSTHFLVTLLAHPMSSNQENELIFSSLEEIIAFSNQVSEQILQVLKAHLGEYVQDILELAQTPQSSSELLQKIGLTRQSKNKQKRIDPLLTTGWLQYTVPQNPKDRNQRYKLSESGKKVLALLPEQPKT